MSEQDARANPYVGLRPFFDDDSLYFFGREQQTAALLDILREHRFLGVVGSSGSGKSSLVRAGLLPGLLGGFLVRERDRWRSVQMKPGDAPISNLVEKLLAAMGQTPTPEAIAMLEREVREGHTDAVIEFLTPRLEANANLFLLVDQFEEIFAFRGLEDEDAAVKNLDLPRRKERARRQAEASDFVDLLLALAEQRILPIYVALTMRTDFLGDCDLFYGLPEALNRGRYLVPRMTREQLRDAVECPALLFGASVAPRMLDHVLNELGDRFDRLPVLQHALLRTWDEWRDAGGVGPIDLRHFESAGGLEGALDQDAEAAFEGLDVNVTARVFKRLTDTDASQRRVRSPARISKLMAVAGADRAVVEHIVCRFEENNRSFLHRSADGKKDDPRVDISHESLIRQWDRLRNWVDDERLSRDQYKKLVERAQNGARLRDPELQRVLDWWAQATPTPAWARRYSDDDADFDRVAECLRDSEYARESEREEQRKRAEADRRNKERELEQAKALAETQRQRAEEQAAARIRQQRWTYAFGTLLVAAVATLAYAANQTSLARRYFGEAEGQRQERLTVSLVAATEKAINEREQQLALLLGLAGDSVAANPRTRESLRSSLSSQLPQLSVFLSGHNESVNGVAFSPDGQLLASASEDGSVMLWDVASRTLKRTLLGRSEIAVGILAFSRDGRSIAGGGRDGTVLLWNVDNAQGQEVPLKGHGSAVISLAFNADDTSLATGGQDGMVILWNLQDGQILRAKDLALGRYDTESRMLPISIAFNSARTLTAVSEAGALVEWDLATARRRIARKGDGIRTLVRVLSHDGTTLASAGPNNSVILWDVMGRPLRQPRKLAEHPAAVKSLFFSPDGKTIISALGGILLRWDVASGQRVGDTLTAQAEYLTSATLNQAGTMFASGAEDGSVILWNSASPEPAGQFLDGHVDYVTSVAFNHDSTMLASGSDDRSVILWNMATRQPVGKLQGHTDYVTSVAFNKDGTMLASGSEDNTVILWDVATRRPIVTLKGHANYVTAVAFSKDGTMLASASEDNTVILWDVATREPVGAPLIGHRGWVTSVAFSPDDTMLASASTDKTVILWSIASHTPVGAPLKGHRGWVTSVAFSPDGTTLASASADKTVILWNLETPERVREPLKGHRGWVASVAFSPDGATLASGSWDYTVILWDVASGQRVGKPLEGHADFVRSVAFSPDGAALASASDDATVSVWARSLWDMDVPAWRTRACSIANRNLTQAEWDERVGKDEPYEKVCKDLPGPPDKVK